MANTGIYEDDYDGDSILAVESDEESNFEDSPVDGYFLERPHPEDRFVENSAIDAEASAKAREALEQRAGSSRAHPPSHYNPAVASSELIAWANVETPLTNAEQPPPDYESVTASRPATQVTTDTQTPYSLRGSGYGSIGTEPNEEMTNVSNIAGPPWPYNAANQFDFPPGQPWPFDSSGSPFTFHPDRQWPFGNRGSPFHGGFPFGSAGSPLSIFQPSTVPGHATTSDRSVGPQIMSDYVEHHPGTPADDEEAGLLPTPEARQKRKNQKRCCSAFLTRNILLAVVVVVLIIALAKRAHMSSTHDGGKENKTPSQENPGENPAVPTMPPTAPSMPPTAPSMPPTAPSMPPTAPSMPSNPRCPYEATSETVVDIHNLHNFTFTEFIDNDKFSDSGIGGVVQIIPAKQQQDADFRVSLTYATNKPWEVEQPNYVIKDDFFTLQAPTLQKKQIGATGKPCLYILVRINVRPDVSLERLDLVTGNLDIAVQGGLFNSTSASERRASLKLAGTSSFNAVRGNIHMEHWSSRETYIETISGTIKGKFALRDLVSLKSQSGSINADIEPHKVDKSQPRPAELVVTSSAGNIHINLTEEKDKDIPKREYRTRVQGVSSSISGKYILGTSTVIHTTSGSITADLLPYFNRREPSFLDTKTRSGPTRLAIMEPYDEDSAPWSNSRSVHRSTTNSGSVDVKYPPHWEGYMECNTMNGYVHVQGEDVKIISDEKLGPMRSLVAKKGDGNSKMDFMTTSGSIKVEISDNHY